MLDIKNQLPKETLTWSSNADSLVSSDWGRSNALALQQRSPFNTERYSIYKVSAALGSVTDREWEGVSDI